MCLRTHDELKRLLHEREEYGSFYYRLSGGEAASDVYDRINDFLGSFHRDMNHPDLPQNRVLIIHSLAIRLFIMRCFHLTAEEFDAMKSPKNAELIVLEYNPETHSYDLKTPLESDAANVLRSRPIRLQIRTSLDVFLKEVTQKGKAYSNNITILREVLSMRSEYGLQLNLFEYI